VIETIYREVGGSVIFFGTFWCSLRNTKQQAGKAGTPIRCLLQQEEFDARAV